MAHKPELLKYTAVGRSESQINKSGKENFQATNMSEQRPVTAAAFWKSQYNAVAENTLSRPMIKSNRPEWSLPRHAYTSQRTFFVTENMRSYGTYGSKPIEKINKDSD
jgi:hypothetical protein